MNITTLVRTGFSNPKVADLSWCKNILTCKLGEPFQPAWEKVVGSAAEYALIIDDIAPCNERYVWLMHQILRSHKTAAGITIDAHGLHSVYNIEAPVFTSNRIPWTTSVIKTIPSWFSLIRISEWEPTFCLTPEFHLLQQCHNKVLLRILGQKIDFNVISWAGDVISHSSNALASDYSAYCCDKSPGTIPPQFRVTIPSQTEINASFDASTTSPTFSLICPSIRPDFLKEAVGSVLKQTYKDWELWIGIDGPKESQLKKIEEILVHYQSEPRIHIRYYKHMGTGPLRKLLSEMANGEYIFCMDDDDRLSLNALECFAAGIRENPGVPIMRGGIKLFGMVDTYLSPRKRFRINGISNDLFEANQPCVVRKKTLTMLGGFEWDPDMKQAGEDSDLLLKADRAGLPVMLIDQPLYERRLSTLNQTLDCTAEECLNHIHNLYKRHNPDDWILDQVSLSGKGPMINMLTVHKNQAISETVVCSTQFMNFQQVGSRDNVVLDLEITSLCNAACTFCPRSHLERTAKFISLDLVRKVAVSLLKEANTPTVVLCGIGESTLHPELTEVISILADSGANVCMTTNGSQLSLDVVDMLVSAGLSELNISLNASTAETHAALMKLKNFNKIADTTKEIANVRQQRWPHLKLHVSFVLTKRNEDEMNMFVNRWRNAGVSKIWLHPLTNRAGQLAHDCEPGNASKLSAEFQDDPEVQVDLFPREDSLSNLCHIARGVDFLSVDGEMLLCAQDYEAKHRFGNINSESLEQMHHNKILTHLRGETASTCSNCSFCPRSFKNGKDQAYTIVQAGGY